MVNRFYAQATAVKHLLRKVAGNEPGLMRIPAEAFSKLSLLSTVIATAREASHVKQDRLKTWVATHQRYSVPEASRPDSVAPIGIRVEDCRNFCVLDARTDAHGIVDYRRRAKTMSVVMTYSKPDLVPRVQIPDHSNEFDLGIAFAHDHDCLPNRASRCLGATSH